MNTKKVVIGFVKTSLWSAGTYGIYGAGKVIKQVGQELIKQPFLGFYGLALMVVGDLVKVTAVIPGVCVMANAIDIAGGITQKSKPRTEAQD